MTEEPKDLQRAEADTIMFASLRAILPDPTRENRFVGLDRTQSADGQAPGSRSDRHHHRKPAERPVVSPSRRIWLSRGVLALIMLLQEALTLRMSNTAFEDEALYLYVGHLEIAHFLHGAALQGDYPSYFSGAPVLYPVLGALADHIGGLAAARALSLLEMLAVTGLIYAMTRRLFNERVALCAAVGYAVTEPALFLGHLATYDATALFLLTVATWLVVRFSSGARPLYLLAAPVLVLAVATKYATLLWVPSVIALAGLTASPKIGRKALVTSAALCAATVALLLGVARLAGSDYMAGFKFTTLDRFEGDASVSSLLWDSAQWIGVPFLLAVVGVVCWTVRPFTDRGERVGPGGSRLRRALLGGVMAGSALLAPIQQIRIHTETSLFKHVGFGLMLAAPIAGVGLSRIIGDHFRRTQVGIAIWGVLLVVGMSTADSQFDGWPSSTAFIQEFSHYVHPGDHYLVEVDEVPIYYLRHNPGAQPDQFTSTFYFGYTVNGEYITGDPAYVAAIKAGYFNVVSYNYQTTEAVDGVIGQALATNPDYSLVDVIPIANDGARQYVWVKTG
jgi:hypothetical protein